MKRAAICLSGLSRTFEQTHENLMANLVMVNPGYQCDFFISTWAHADSRSSTQGKRLERWGHSPDLIQVVPTPVDRLMAVYRPVAINVETEKVWDVTKFVDRVDVWASPEAWLGMTYKVADCDRLRREYEEAGSFHYDVVVRHRFDSLLPCPVTFDIDPTKLYVPKMWAETYRDEPWINDMFALSSGPIMEVYAGAHAATDELFDRGVVIQPEILLYNHLVLRGVSVEVMNFELQIVR